MFTARAANPAFAAGVTNGFISTYNISEASGLVVSRQNPAVIWTHNDGTYDGYVFAIATNGQLLAQHYVPGVFGVNMEDIAIGPGPLPLERLFVHVPAAVVLVRTPGSEAATITATL